MYNEPMHLLSMRCGYKHKTPFLSVKSDIKQTDEENKMKSYAKPKKQKIFIVYIKKGGEQNHKYDNSNVVEHCANFMTRTKQMYSSSNDIIRIYLYVKIECKEQ